MAQALALLAATGVACSSSVSTQTGWQATVYYTAVEAFHKNSPLVDVAGCPVLECSNGTNPLGRYPQTFVDAVKDEGSGRITSGTAAGRYLNWSGSEGYWLDTAPRDRAGRPLEPYRTAAADGVPEGTLIHLHDCGHNEADPPAPEECAALVAAEWQIRDAFESGYGGQRHVDLYIGEEDRPDFTRSNRYTTLDDATLELTTAGR